MEFDGNWKIRCSRGNSLTTYGLQDGDVMVISGTETTRTIQAPKGRSWGTQTATFRGNVLDGRIGSAQTFTITLGATTEKTICCSINGGVECFGGKKDIDESGSWTADDDPCTR